jgi:hypothetical protein
MDRGTRIYAVLLLAIVLALVMMSLYQPANVRALNHVLETDAEVSAYPYPFRVLRVEQGTAVMGTPRSAAMPVARMIAAVAPEAAGLPDTDPVYLRAQQRLADTQARARSLVLADPAIERVRWELDENWLSAHGIVSVH